MRFLIRTSGFLLILAVVVGGLVWSFWPQPVLVESTRIGFGPIQVMVEEDGKTRIKERYEVSAPVSGLLSRITLDPGDRVEAGATVLATLSPNEPDLLDPRTVAQAEARIRAAESALERSGPLVDRAQNELTLAEAQLRRAQQLARANAVSDERLEEAEAIVRSRAQDLRSATFARDVARFELELARAALWKRLPDESAGGQPPPLLIRSPINGSVLRVFEESAKPVLTGTRLLELGDPTNLEIEVDVLSNDAVKIRPGTKAFLEQWGGGSPLKALVRRVEPAAFTKISALGVEEQRVNVVLDLDEPLERRRALGDGFRVEARIVIWESNRVLLVPTGALFRQQGDWAVFVVHEQRARLRRVKIGHRNSLVAEVLGGLAERDTVLLHPSDQIADGTPVQFRTLPHQ